MDSEHEPSINNPLAAVPAIHGSAHNTVPWALIQSLQQARHNTFLQPVNPVATIPADHRLVFNTLPKQPLQNAQDPHGQHKQYCSYTMYRAHSTHNRKSTCCSCQSRICKKHPRVCTQRAWEHPRHIRKSHQKKRC